MEKIYHSLTELIGRTPLLEISHIEKKEQLKARVLVKLESFNPGGSVKDRAAFYMIEAAEKEGLLHPGSLIIEHQRKHGHRTCLDCLGQRLPAHAHHA